MRTRPDTPDRPATTRTSLVTIQNSQTPFAGSVVLVVVVMMLVAVAAAVAAAECVEDSDA